MKQATQGDSKPFILKDIPVARVQVIKNPRLDLNQSRVDYFKDIYHNEASHHVPPIEVLLVQSGIPDTATYALLDGLHRLTAHKELKRAIVTAKIYHSPAYTIEDLKKESTQLEILSMACPYNTQPVSLPLTLAERIQSAAELKRTKTTEEIAKALNAGNRTIERWLHSLEKEQRAHRKEENERKKKTAFELFSDDIGIRSVARQLELPASTVGDWKQEYDKETFQKDKGCPVPPHGGSGHPAMDKFPLDRSHHNNTPLDNNVPSDNMNSYHPVDDLLTEAAPPVPQISEKEKNTVIDQLNHIGDIVRDMQWYDAADSYVLHHLLLLLKKKSPVLDAAILTSDNSSTVNYEKLYAELSARYTSLQNNVADLREKHIKLQKERDVLKQDVALIESDSRQSDLSKKWVKIELYKTLEFAMNLLRQMQTALTEGIVRDKKQNPIAVPDAAVPAIRQITLDLIFPLASHFEWAQENEIATDDAKMSQIMSDYLEIVDTLKLNGIKEVKGRIALLERRYELVGGGRP